MKKEFTNILNASSIEQVKEYTDAFLKLLGSKKVSVTRGKVARVTKIKKANDYVYDIGMKNKNHPWFFANNILIHNSVYFSAYPTLKKDIKEGTIPWDKDSIVSLYDQISAQVDTTFIDFAAKAFHCAKSRAEVIKAGREIVASSGLFITKKRYAALVYDDEGKRKDVDGAEGKVKAMGLDLRRSDTPVYMQDFLKEILLMVLTNVDREIVLDRISTFRKEFIDRPGWEKGTPKRVNKLGHYQHLEEKQGKANMPGHVRAAINWNTLKRMHSDRYSQEAVDGMKCIVCKLKPNPLGYTSVAYPTDELRLPDWFKELPFDDDAMAETIIDNKLGNLIGVLDYDLESTKQTTTFNSLFDF